MRSLVDVRARTLFIAGALLACSGQGAPTPDKPVTFVAPPAPIYVTPDAPVPAIVGAACSDRAPCGPGLTCDPTSPGGTCSMACPAAGSGCGDGGVCVEYPAVDACRARCASNADCRADEGYSCDPVWKGCVLASAPTIAMRSCPAPIGIARDPAFAPATPVGTGAGEPTAAIADDGSVVVAYERPDRNGLALANIDLAGRLIGSTDFDGASAPALARDGAALHLAMVKPDGKRRTIALATSKQRGAGWSPPFAIADRECATAADCTQPAIIAGTDPQRRGERMLYVAYSAGGGIRIRASRDGTAFGPPITAVPGERASLAVAGDGTLYVVALRGSKRGSYGSGDQEVVMASSGDGGRSFTRPQRVSRDGERIPFYFGTPRIEVDSARKWIYIAYTRGGRDGKWDLALAATKDKGKTWARARLGDDPPCATHAAPQLALDPARGALHVAWYDSRGTRYAHATCADGLRACRQLGRINDVAFAGLSLARHGPLAASEATALVVDHQRRALHAVWSQPVEGPESRIFHARAKLPLR